MESNEHLQAQLVLTTIGRHIRVTALVGLALVGLALVGLALATL